MPLSFSQIGASEMDLQKVKDYLKVDYDDDDVLITGFMAAAKQYMSNAGVKEQTENELYNIVVLMLISLFYENRDSGESNLKISPVLNTFIVQLSCVVSIP